MFSAVDHFIICALIQFLITDHPYHVTSRSTFYKAASIPTTATPRPRTGPAVWKAPAPVAAVAAALPEDAAPDAEWVALPDGVLVPEMAVSAAELDAKAAAEPEAEEEAEPEAEELEFDPQLGLVFRVTPYPLHRVVANLIVADVYVSLFETAAIVTTYSGCQLRCKQPKRSKKLR
jgi:hypothetical protein